MLPFRGRTSELDIIAGRVTSASGGCGSVVLVEGPAGIGKTRLLDEVARRAAEQGLAVVSGGANEVDQVTPWGPLRRALSSMESAAIEAGQPVAQNDRSDQCPGMHERIRLTLARAAARPLLVVLDDLQWADPETLIALGSMPRELSGYPILWVLGRRLVPAPSQIRALVGQWGEEGVLRGPGPLASDDANLLAADLLGARPEWSVERLIAQAHGNPYYLVEALTDRTTTHTRQGNADSTNRDGKLSPSFGAAVDGHLRTLSAPAQQLIKFASVLGLRFTVAELCAVTGQSVGSLMAAIEETLAAEVLSEDADQLEFRVDLFRRAVYERLPVPLRAALHLEAATALQARGAPVVRVAEHLAIAAQPGDERAIGALIEAMDQLVPTAPSAAADLALRVLELVAPEDPRRPNLVVTAIGLLGTSFRFDEARALAKCSLTENEVPGALEAEIRIGVRQAWAMSTFVPYPTPLPSRLLLDSNFPPRVIPARFIGERSTPAQIEAPQSERAGRAVRVRGRQMVAELMDDGDERSRADVLAVQAHHAFEHGYFVEALHAAESGLRLTSQQPSAMLTSHQINVMTCLGKVGRLREALEVLGRLDRAATVSHNVHLRSRCLSKRASLLVELGQLDAARATAQRAVEAAKDLGAGFYLQVALTALVEVYTRQGDIGEAIAATETLVSLAPPGLRMGHMDRWAAACCLVAEGKPASALDTLTPLVGRLSDGGWYLYLLLPKVVSLAVGADKFDLADTAVQVAVETARRNPDLLPTAAVAAHTRGLYHGDAAMLRRAVTLFAQGERPLVTAAAREDLGHVLKETGRNDEAIAALEAGYVDYQTANAHHDLARVRSALRTLGVRKHQPTSSGWPALTKSEVAVVEIVAQGNTNREVANRLFLSPETVRTHLRHAFTKLGIHSRVELADLVAQHQQG